MMLPILSVVLVLAIAQNRSIGGFISSRAQGYYDPVAIGGELLLRRSNRWLLETCHAGLATQNAAQNLRHQPLPHPHELDYANHTMGDAERGC